MLLCPHYSSCVLAPYTSLVSVSSNSRHEVHVSQKNRKALNITLFTENSNSLKRKVELNAEVI